MKIKKLSTQIKKQKNGGFVLVIVLVGLVALTFLLMTGNITTTTGVKISGNYVRTVDAFNIAEAGIARARPLLENVDFDTKLAQYQSTPLIASTAFNGGSYSVTLANDEKDLASGGTATNDTNSIVKMTSVGVTSSGARATIVNYIQIVGGTNAVSLPAAPPGGQSAALFCGTGMKLDLQGAANVNGDDYAAPVLPCSGASCNTSVVATNTNDIVSENALGACTGGCSSLTKNTTAGASANCTQWKTLAGQLSALSASNPNVVVLTGTSYKGDIGPCTNPKVVIISTTAATFEIKGNSSICGTVVIASDTLLSTQGTVSINGLLLFMGGNSATKGIEWDPQGTANMNGKVIFGSAQETNTKSISVQGNSVVHYSSEAVNYALAAINNANAGGGSSGTGQLMSVGWEESY